MIRVRSWRSVFRGAALAGMLAVAVAAPVLPRADAAGPLTPQQLAALRARMVYSASVAGVRSDPPPPPPAPPEVAPLPVEQVTLPGGTHLSNLPANFHYPAVAPGAIHPFEKQMLDLVNAERAKAGLAAVAWDGDLAYIARMRTRQMGDQGYFGHVDPYGYRMWIEFIRRWQIPFLKAGENLVANGYAEADTVQRAVEGLMGSPTHRANILDPKFTHLGIGLYDDDGYRYFAQIFAGR